MIINEDTQIPNLCKQITKLSTKDGVLDTKEQDRRLAMLFADKCMPYVKYAIKPEKPEQMKRYESLSKDKKFLFEKENPAWREWSTVSDYMSACSAADAGNDSNVYWLKHWMRLVDEPRRKVLKLKLLEFEINMPSRPTQREVTTVYAEAADPGVQKIKEMFDGNEIKGGWKAHTRKGIPNG